MDKFISYSILEKYVPVLDKDVPIMGRKATSMESKATPMEMRYVMKMTENEDGTIEFQANKKSKWLWRWGLKGFCSIPLVLCVVLLSTSNKYYSFNHFVNSGDLSIVWISILIFMFGWVISKLKMTQAHRTFYRLTRHGIELRKGILAEEILTVPWRAVKMVKVLRRDIDLMMNQGQVHVECAGDTYPEIIFKGLDEWDQVKDILLERMAMDRK